MNFFIPLKTSERAIGRFEINAIARLSLRRYENGTG
jgi:hypothetical protein